MNPSPLWEALAERPVVAHNAVFDLGFLAALGFAPGVVALHDADESASARHAARRRASTACNRPPKGSWAGCSTRRNSDPTGPAELTPEQLSYAAADAAILPPLFADLTAKIKAAGLDARRRDRAALPPRRGVAVPVRRRPGLPGVGGAGRRGEAAGRGAGREAGGRRPAAGRLAAPRATGGIGTVPIRSRRCSPPSASQLESTGDDALAAVDHPLAGLVREYRGRQAGVHLRRPAGTTTPCTKAGCTPAGSRSGPTRGA